MLLDLLVPPRCLACGAAGADLCASCRRALPFLRSPCSDHAYAPLAYDGPARALVAALKFRNHRRAAAVMAAQIAANAPAWLFAAGGVLVPAPAHPVRVRRRGHDQALTLARALQRRTGLPLQQVLRRSGAHVRQVGAGRAERLRSGRIEVAARAPAPPRAILVDDVRTTGATLAACARALREAGALDVLAVTYARTL